MKLLMDKYLVVENKTIDPAAQRILERAEAMRISTAFSRVDEMRPCPTALLDGQVGIQLLNACQRATCSLVWANLPALVDASLIEAIRTRLEELNTNSEAINGEPAGADPQPAMIHRQA